MEKVTKWFRSVFYSLGFIMLIWYRAAKDDMQIIWEHARLFMGVALLICGLLNFDSYHYCDNGVTTSYGCNHPVTYYFYDWFAIGLVIVGVAFLWLWYLHTYYYTAD